MPWRSAQLAVVSPLLIVAAIGASPCATQTRLTSHEELRRELAVGDVITIVPSVGQPVTGRLMRLGPLDLDVGLADKRTPQDRGARDVTIALDAIQSLERPRDSTRNGATIGAGIGAGISGAMFIRAIIIDRNEIDEWATLYVGVAAVFTGIGAVIGWAIDAATSKPHVRFDAFAAGRTNVSVQPMFAGRRGIAIAVSF